MQFPLNFLSQYCAAVLLLISPLEQLVSLPSKGSDSDVCFAHSKICLIMAAKKENIFSPSLFPCFFDEIKYLPLEVRGFCRFFFQGSKTVATTCFETCFVFGGVVIDGINWCLKGVKVIYM